MVRHNYNIELVTDAILDEDDISELEQSMESWLRSVNSGLVRINLEYIDSEG